MENVVFNENHPTNRAADKWDSARFLAGFDTSTESCSQADSTPAHLRQTHTVGRFGVNAMAHD
jgi:hypothetical protein